MNGKADVIAEQFILKYIITFLFGNHLLKNGIEKTSLFFYDFQNRRASDFKEGRLLQAFGAFGIFKEFFREKDGIPNICGRNRFPRIGDMRIAEEENGAFLFKRFIRIMNFASTGGKAYFIKVFPAVGVGITAVMFDLECLESLKLQLAVKFGNEPYYLFFI